MPISFICPHCGRHTDVAEQFAGQTGPCAGCKRPVAIPTLAEWNETNKAQTVGGGAVGLAAGGIVALVILGIGSIVLVPALLRMQHRSQLSAEETNLKALAGAMQAYHDRWGCFPPAITYGPNGAPYHSWRVLLLPYLDQGALYAQYNFNEPWDGPNNRGVLEQMPAAFSTGTPDGSTTTPFVVVTGDQTMFPSGTTTSKSDAIKGAAATGLIVESMYYQVPWTSPTDLAYDTMNYLINDPDGMCISGTQPDGALIAMADGSTQFLNAQTYTEQQVQVMLLRNVSPFVGTPTGPAVLFSSPVDLMRRYEAVEFGDKANQILDEDFHGGQVGNNLSLLPRGDQVFGGVEFLVGDKMLSLGAKEGQTAHLPARIDGLPVGKRAERVHFLHATGFQAPSDGTPIGHYEIHYADGTTEMAKIVYGVDVRDWWDGDNSRSLDDGRMVWVGQNPAIQGQSGVSQIRLFLSTWENPRPADEIATIDFVGYQATECAPFCVAIALDNPRESSAASATQEASDSSDAALETMEDPAFESPAAPESATPATEAPSPAPPQSELSPTEQAAPADSAPTDAAPTAADETVSE